MAFDAFLKIDTIDGESTNIKYAKWIEIMSFSWGVTDPRIGSSQPGQTPTSGKAQVHDISFTKFMDTASPTLFQKACEGAHLGEAQLTLVRTGDRQEEFLKIKLTDILVSGVQHSGGGGIVTEAFSLSFGSALISAADDKGQFTSVSTCGAASFSDIKEPPVIIEKK